GFRTYILFPGGPRLAEPPTAGAAPPTPGTSGVWNDMNAQALPRNNFDGLGVPVLGLNNVPQGNPNTVPFLAWFALAPGSVVPIAATQATRRFYGTVNATAVIANPLAQPAAVRPGGVTVAPIAQNAGTVKLVGNPGLVFVIRGNTPFANFGPFPAN